MSSALVQSFDWKQPDYTPIIKHRMQTLQRIRAQQDDKLMANLKRVYRDQPWLFINDWGVTYDPRNVDIQLPAAIPFIMFPRQVEWCKWVIDRWRAREPGETPKSRDVGVSWMFVSLMVTLCLFHEGFAAGVGSRKEEYVDLAGSPKALFWKARKFIQFLPPEFRAGHVAGKHDPHMRLIFPETGSTFTGEAGDNIGRGDRASIYGVDEAAYLMRPQLIDASLSATTNCRIDISSANGTANPFYEKVSTYADHLVFPIHWRDDPRKDDEWYRKQCEFLDPVTVAQEIDINFAASVEGVVIPSQWIESAVDAHIHLNIHVTGERRGALDVADEGIDNNAFAGAYGILLDYISEWSGQNSDIFQTVVKAFAIADDLGLDSFLYDADGMGAGVRGDARVINQQRQEAARVSQSAPPPRLKAVTPFWGSGAVTNPTAKIAPGADRTNEDYYKNLKAQSWGHLKARFKETFRARHEPGYQYDPSMIISLAGPLSGEKAIPPKVLTKLKSELAQPTWGPNNEGKMVVDKQPEVNGRKAKSPNLADVVMMLFGSARRRMQFSAEAARNARQR